MKPIFLGLLICGAWSSMCIAGPLKETEHSILVTTHPDFTSCINAIWKAYERDGIAVAAEKKESGMVELRFREGIATNETKVHLTLMIPEVIDNVRVVPEIQFNKEFNSWKIQINQDLLDRTTLTLGAFAQGTIIRRKYKLRTDANKPGARGPLEAARSTTPSVR